MSERDESAVVIERRSGGAGTGIAMFLLGAAIGAGVALLFAPQSGEETRADLRRGARRLKRKARDIVDQGGEVVDDLKRQGRSAVKDARSAIEDRLARHRETMTDTGEDGV
jgi:gas vesicle protein